MVCAVNVQLTTAAPDSSVLAEAPHRAQDRLDRGGGRLRRGIDDQVVAVPGLVLSIQDLLPARQREAGDAAGTR
jgi:hypothetical protein